MSSQEAQKWPDLIEIVERKVKGTRASHSTAEWWHFERLRPELYEAIRGLDRVLVVSRVGQALAFTFCSTDTVFAETLVVLAASEWSSFVIVQARPHEVWSRVLASSLKDDLRYTPSDCFETFPLPNTDNYAEALSEIGSEYYKTRVTIMVRNNEGLTKTYNRFHDPDERDPEVGRLRDLHDEMDRAVLDAYGWSDITTACDFFLDYEEETDETAPSSKKRKRYRYRWPDDVRDEVLARLLELNRQRAEDERLAGPLDDKRNPKGRRQKPKPHDGGPSALF